nr:MAG TPA: hypothetical protein [Caudoviricetes sp.]
MPKLRSLSNRLSTKKRKRLQNRRNHRIEFNRLTKMEEYTQADFDAFEVIDGIKQCPSGDYSDIQIFGEWCSFGKWCSFGEDCFFGEECSFEGKGEYIGDYPFLAFVGFGSRIGSKVYFFNLQDGIYVRCGCWLSNIAGFRERVKEKNADAMYLDLCDLVERKFNRKNSK